MDKIKEIADKFKISGTFYDAEIFGSGHINVTYLVTYKKEDSSLKKYIIQKVNTNVFKNINELMENVFDVTSYLRKIIKSNGGDENRETLHYIKTKDDKLYYKAEDGYCYRSYVFVTDSITYNSVESPELFKKSGEAFGKFQRMLSDYPANTLHETIPNFHNTESRFKDFEKSLKDNLSGRASNCQSEIDFVLARKNDCSVLTSKIETGELPLRVTHNDTKLNNVMFDEKTGECICVIDLDTVMPGLALYDFGDSIRFGANTAAEDEADLSKVSLSLEYFKAYAEGFLSMAGEALTDKEKELLAFSAKLMTFECGMRFLADYIDGDTYFKTSYPEHNLVRAKNQFKLVSDMEAKMPQMEEIIKELSY